MNTEHQQLTYGFVQLVQPKAIYTVFQISSTNSYI